MAVVAAVWTLATLRRTSVSPVFWADGWTWSGLVVTTAYVVGAIAPRRAWMVPFGSGLLIATMLPLCCLPIALPVLFAWDDSLVRLWFQRGSETPPPLPWAGSG